MAIQLTAAGGDLQVVVNTGDDTATIAIVDNDTASLSVNDVQIIEGDSGSVEMVFSIGLLAAFINGLPPVLRPELNKE